MDTAYLETFREVARRGSFTAAATALGYTQPAVSRQISALEAQLGVVLFDRLPRGVRLSAEGQCVLEHADAVLERLESAQRELAALRDLSAGTLRVGAFPTSVATLMPRAMATFGAAHPSVALSLVEGSSRRQLTRVEAGEVHVAVVSELAGQRYDRERFELVHLLDDPLLVALPRSHRLAGRRTVRFSALAQDSWIGGDVREDDSFLTPANLPTASVARIDFVVRGWTEKLGLVAAGLGVTLVPSLAVEATRTDVALVALDPVDAPPRAVYAATLRGVARPPAVEAFIEVLGETAAER